jgi:hypothetical protein
VLPEVAQEKREGMAEPNQPLHGMSSRLVVAVFFVVVFVGDFILLLPQHPLPG